MLRHDHAIIRPQYHHHHHHQTLQPKSGPGLPCWGFHKKNRFCGAGLLVHRPTPNLEDQASIFMTPRDRVAQLYPQALGGLLGQEWVTMGLFFNPGHHTG
jgi:hypothetical protein